MNPEENMDDPVLVRVTIEPIKKPNRKRNKNGTRR